MLNNKIRSDFPIFTINPGLIYLDSTATALKPQLVLNKLNEYYQEYSANVFRGLYPISEKATAEYELARAKVAQFIHGKANEVVFVRGTTEALNLVAYSLGRQILDSKSEIVVSVVEHHANFVPWQQLALENGSSLKVLEMDERGLVPLDDHEYTAQVINKNTKIVALYYVSNVLGTINPLSKIIKNIRAINPKTVVVIDAAQAAPSIPIDVKALDCDFLAFSGHKIMGPTGIGVLWGREKYLASCFPFQYGGEMIEKVTIEKTTFQSAPHKFEAGTPHIAGAIGLGAALDYLKQFSYKDILKHERCLWQRAFGGLKQNKNVVLLGPSNTKNRTGILAFQHRKIHSHDLSQILAQSNVCIRAGHHCAMPLHTHLGINASCRLSFYLYNTEKDVEQFLVALDKAEKLLI